MAITDAAGLPVAAHVESASPHEVKLVEATIDNSFTEYAPNKLVGDKAYDSDKLEGQLRNIRGVEMAAPHRRERKKPRTQDGRKLRCYRRRWKIERLFAWLQNFRRLVVRYEYHVENFQAMVHLGCVKILLRFFEMASIEKCRQCPLTKNCPAKKGAKYYDLRYSQKTMRVVCRRQQKQTDAFKQQYQWRAGVEATMNQYDRLTGVKRLRV